MITTATTPPTTPPAIAPMFGPLLPPLLDEVVCGDVFSKLALTHSVFWQASQDFGM